MEWFTRARSVPALRKGAIVGAVVLLAYALFGFLALPGILAAITFAPFPLNTRDDFSYASVL